MNGRPTGTIGPKRLATFALATLMVVVSCGGDNDAPTPFLESTPAASSAAPPASRVPAVAPPESPPSPQPPPSPEPAPTSMVEPTLLPSTLAPTAPPEPAFEHRSVVVVIPDDAASSGASVGTSDPPASASPAPVASSVPFVSQDSIDTVDKRLNVSVGGQTVYIRNGGRIEMGDGLAVEVYIDPYPPTTLHSVLDVYVTQDGEPLSDISVDVEFDMLSMLHGPFSATARDIGGGHHLATLNYIMFGAWDQFVTIRIGLDRLRFPVVIVAYP